MTVTINDREVLEEAVKMEAEEIERPFIEAKKTVQSSTHDVLKYAAIAAVLVTSFAAFLVYYPAPESIVVSEFSIPFSDWNVTVTK